MVMEGAEAKEEPLVTTEANNVAKMEEADVVTTVSTVKIEKLQLERR